MKSFLIQLLPNFSLFWKEIFFTKSKPYKLKINEILPRISNLHLAFATTPHLTSFEYFYEIFSVGLLVRYLFVLCFFLSPQTVL